MVSLAGGEHVSRVRFSHDEDVVEDFAPDAADDALAAGVHPRGPRCTLDHVQILGLIVTGASQTAGWLSDRFGRHKPFIATAALLFGVGMLILSQADTVALFYCAELVLGLGFGMYLGVDLALVIDVLPDPENPSKDLGIFNIAMSAPQIFAPALGALLISLGGGHNYSILLITSCLVCLCGALAILPVRKVR
ncbi:MFS transporter [Streptomyces sp. NPDC055092]